MQFGISIPQHFVDGSFESRAFRAYMVRAEELGFESAWTQEQVLGANPHLNPIEVMTFAAACTERIRLGCAVFVSSLHSPVHLAKSLSTLDQLSLGRVEVGVGIGGATRMVSAFGVDPEFLVARFIEGVRLMKACWTEPLIDFDGRFWQLEGAAMEPKPMQKPHPPMWFGVGHPNGLRRAVQHANGFFGAGSTTTAQFREQVGIVRRELAALEEAKGGFRIAKRVYVVVNNDPVQARAELSPDSIGSMDPMECPISSRLQSPVRRKPV